MNDKGIKQYAASGLISSMILFVIHVDLQCCFKKISNKYMKG